MSGHEFYSDILNIPTEILDFAYKSFMLVEVRVRVGKVDRLIFTIRTNEGKHFRPHVHAEYGEYFVSVAIDKSEILAGNLPRKQMRIAQDWVTAHKEILLGKWRSIAIDREIPMTMTALDKFTSVDNHSS